MAPTSGRPAPELRVPPAAVRAAAPAPTEVSEEVVQRHEVYRTALPGSWGEAYLRRRGIPLALAVRYGAGYAAGGTWLHPKRDWKWGRLVFPHTDAGGRIVSLYGRAVGADEKVPKPERHDHLPGAKGYFNAAALSEGDGPLFVCEGVFDALSLIAAGYTRAVAIFGVDGWRWEWARQVGAFVLALDADAAGQASWRELARQAVLRGRRVAILPPETYLGHKDLSALWASTSAIDLGDPAMLVSAADDRGTESVGQPETCVRCGAPVDEFTEDGTPLCRRCYVQAVCG